MRAVRSGGRSIRTVLLLIAAQEFLHKRLVLVGLTHRAGRASERRLLAERCR